MLVVKGFPAPRSFVCCDVGGGGGGASLGGGGRAAQEVAFVQLLIFNVDRSIGLFEQILL